MRAKPLKMIESRFHGLICDRMQEGKKLNSIKMENVRQCQARLRGVQ